MVGLTLEEDISQSMCLRSFECSAQYIHRHDKTPMTKHVNQKVMVHDIHWHFAFICKQSALTTHVSWHSLNWKLQARAYSKHVVTHNIVANDLSIDSIHRCIVAPVCWFNACLL